MEEFYYVIRLPNGNYWSHEHRDGVRQIRRAGSFWAMTAKIVTRINAAGDHIPTVPSGSVWVKVRCVPEVVEEIK